MKRLFATLIPVLGIALMLNGFQTQAGQLGGLFDGKKSIAILVTEGFNDEETLMPMAYLMNKGYDVTVIGPDTGMVRASGSEFEIRIQEAIRDADPGDFDVLIIPGGESAEILSEDLDIVNFANEFHDSGNIVAAMPDGQRFLETAEIIDDPEASGGVERIEEGLEEFAEMFSDDIDVNGNVITAKGATSIAKFTMAVEQALISQNNKD